MRCSPESVRDGRRNPGAESNGNICGKRIAWVKYARVSVALFQVETNKSESAQNMGDRTNQMLKISKESRISQ